MAHEGEWPFSTGQGDRGLQKLGALFGCPYEDVTVNCIILGVYDGNLDLDNSYM